MNKTAKTRNYGEGSVYQRGDGRWVAKYKSDEMTKPRVLYAKSEPEAKRKLRDFKKEAARGVVECRKVLFGDYAERWLYTFKQHSMESSSFDRYESTFLAHIKPAFGDMQLSKIRGTDIQKLLVSKSDDCSYTVAKFISVLLTDVFEYAHSEGDLAKNPMRNVKMPKKTTFKPEREIVVLENDEVRALEKAAAATTKKGSPLIVHAQSLVFLVHTGLRCGEYLALEWSDIDFERKTVTVSKSLALVYDRDKSGKRLEHKTALIKDPKTASGNRIVPLNDKAIAALRSLQAYYREQGIKSSSVAVSRNGTILYADQLRRVLRRALEYAGIEKRLTLHHLRHTFATRALQSGIPITVVSKWLGHASISITYSTYIHVLKSEETMAIDLLQAM